MKTGNILSKYKKYSLIWAMKILNNEEGYSLIKAREIDPFFAELVEARIQLLKQFEQAKENIKTTWAYALVIADKWLVEESKKLAEMTIGVDAYAKNLKSDIKVRSWQAEQAEQVEVLMNKVTDLSEQADKVATIEATREMIKLADDMDLTQEQVLNAINQGAKEVKSYLDTEWEAIQKKTESMSQEELEKALEEVWGKDND